MIGIALTQARAKPLPFVATDQQSALRFKTGSANTGSNSSWRFKFRKNSDCLLKVCQSVAVLCIGGQNLDRQVQRLRRNPHFVIGTQVNKDLIQRRAIDTQQFTNVVLDEVDRMLDIGFRKGIMLLISQPPRERQSALFSATMNSQADGVARTFLQNPERFQIKLRVYNIRLIRT